MKRKSKLVLIMGIAFLAIPALSQQWQYVAQDYRTCVTNGITTILVGTNGYILRSQDTANTWELPYSNTFEDLLSAAFIDNDFVVCGGTKGVLIRSTDAGVTWSTISSSIQASIIDIIATAPTTLLALTDDNGIHKSTDKGLSWNQISSTPNTAQDAAFANSANGIVVTVTGEIYHTTDSAQTWTLVYSDTSKGIKGVQWINNVYLACGKSGVILSASIDAKKWSLLPQTPTTINGTSIISTGDRIIVVGASNSGDGRHSISYSPTGGLTWNFIKQELQIHSYAEFRNAVFLKNKTIVVCGNHGMAIKINQQGTDWKFITSTFLDVQGWGKSSLSLGGDFANKDTGIIIANQFLRGAWLRTTDRGITWTQRDGAFLDLLIKPKFIPYKQNFICIGKTYGDILTSPTSADEWTGSSSNRVPNRPINTTDICWIDADNAYLVQDSVVFRTIDGGKNWKGVVIPLAAYGYLHKVSFVSPSTGIIAGIEYLSFPLGPVRTVLLRTTDGGESWNRVYENASGNQITAIALRNEQHIFFGFPSLNSDNRPKKDTSLIFSSIDGGDSWDSLLIVGGFITEIKFYSSEHSIATGSNGMIYQSANGGKTWAAQRVPDVNLSQRPHWYGSILSRDGKTLFLTGNGEIIRAELPEAISAVPITSIKYPAPTSFFAHFDPLSETLDITLYNTFPVNEKITIVVSDLLGRVIYQEAITPTIYNNKSTLMLSSSSLPSGYYIIQVIGKEVMGSGTTIVAR